MGTVPLLYLKGRADAALAQGEPTSHEVEGAGVDVVAHGCLPQAMVAVLGDYATKTRDRSSLGDSGLPAGVAQVRTNATIRTRQVSPETQAHP
jgi:hypothetical protein